MNLSLLSALMPCLSRICNPALCRTDPLDWCLPIETQEA